MINVSCVTPFICVTFKTTSQEGRFYHRTIMFPVIQRYCSADVKILVLSFTFATQKSTKKTPKHVANSSSCQHSDAHMRNYSPDLFISGTPEPEHPNTQCTFCSSLLSCRKRYIDRELDIKFRANR